MNEFIQTFPEKWQEKWTSQGFEEPSLIQQAVFQKLREKESLVAISPTGSGKTLAYLWPLLLNVQPQAGSSLLILTSSQELAIQVTEVARTWAALVDLKVQSLLGGANVKRQVEGLKKKPEILVGTPGRVLELMKGKKLKAHQIQTMVFDEADQLFDESSVQLVKQILHQAPVDYQLAFFSATADRLLEMFEEISGKQLQVVDVSKEDESRKGLQHYFLRVPARKKDDYLRRLMHVAGFQGLVFFNQLSELGLMEEKLTFRGVTVGSLASDQNKLLRKAALDYFKAGKTTALLTTDVAARGLDIAKLPYVINAEVPFNVETYLHRSGRTGRMGNAGMVITLVQDNQLRDMKKIAREANITMTEIYLYGGMLHHEPAEKEEKTERPLKKVNPTVAKHTKMLPETEKINKKNKNKKKTKKQKNKGARRK